MLTSHAMMSVTYVERHAHIGLSFKTQALYAAVFVTRYLDLFWSYISLYNTLMKIFFIASSVYVLFLMRTKFRYVLLLLSFLLNKF
jgi:hypothetical protein